MSRIESVAVGYRNEPSADQLHAWRSIWRILLRPATGEAKPGLVPPEPAPAMPPTSSAASTDGHVDAPLGTRATAHGSEPEKDGVCLSCRRTRDRPTVSGQLLPLERSHWEPPFDARQGQGGDR